MRRVTLLLLALCCCLVAAPSAFAQSGDSDGDGTPDHMDECPTQAPSESQKGGSRQCPDADGDGVPDHRDDCPTTYAQGTSRGCGDNDRDGVMDPADACPTEGRDPRWPNRKPGADGCYPTFVEVTYGAGEIEDVAEDERGIIRADCDYHREQPCVVRLTMTLSATTAKALGLKKRLIADMKIPLTTPAEKEAAHPRPPECLCRPPKQGKLNLGLSSRLKKKIAKLSSLTMTMRATYALGSAEPVTVGAKTLKLSRKPRFDRDSGRVTNIPGFNEEVFEGEQTEDLR